MQAHYRDYNQMTYARSVLAIHNMAHQGRGPMADLNHLEVQPATAQQAPACHKLRQHSLLYAVWAVHVWLGLKPFTSLSRCLGTTRSTSGWMIPSAGST